MPTSTGHYLARRRPVPQDTSSQRWLAPLHVDVQVPKVTIPRCTLQIAYWTGGPFGQALHGVWGDNYLMDDHDGNDPEDLTVVGVRATAEQYAAWAADWLVHQLERPVVRHEWLRGGRVAAATWRLEDTGRVLGKTGPSRAVSAAVLCSGGPVRPVAQSS